VSSAKRTPYAQLSQRPPTDLYTTYCGAGGGQVQILGIQPGMSTRMCNVSQAFFGGRKIPWQIKVFAERRA
jgi:hypothetical protein